MISPERCFAPSAPPPPANHSTDLDGDLAVVTFLLQLVRLSAPP